MHIEPDEPVNLFYLIIVFYHKQEENACFFYKLKYLSKNFYKSYNNSKRTDKITSAGG